MYDVLPCMSCSMTKFLNKTQVLEFGRHESSMGYRRANSYHSVCKLILLITDIPFPHLFK